MYLEALLLTLAATLPTTQPPLLPHFLQANLGVGDCGGEGSEGICATGHCPVDSDCSDSLILVEWIEILRRRGAYEGGGGGKRSAINF
jgi:hypothetical protein